MGQVLGVGDEDCSTPFDSISSSSCENTWFIKPTGQGNETYCQLLNYEDDNVLFCKENETSETLRFGCRTSTGRRPRR